jgi:hypothetical protein
MFSIKSKVSNLSQSSNFTKRYYTGLSRTDYQVMENGFTNICQQNGGPDVSILNKLPLRQYAHPRAVATVTGRFKTYMLVSEGLKKNGIFNEIDYDEVRNIIEAIAIEKDSVQRINEKLIDTYIQRRIPKNDISKIKTTLSKFGSNSKYWVSDNFLVVTTKANKIDLKIVAINMEKALSYFQKTYNLRPQENYITIYLVQDFKKVREYIQKLYSINISFDPLGYSNFYDNSIVGWLYNGTMVGTLKHELIHILIKSQFNFIPEWFEEGLACLYEESKFDKSDNLEGKQNWRGILLRETKFNYTLGDLFANRNVNFNLLELKYLREKYKTDIRRISERNETLRWLYKDHHQELDEVLDRFLINRTTLYKDALSRYFLLYLQDKGKLSKMYQALLQRDDSALDIMHYQTLESVILNICEKINADELQRDFMAWLDGLRS